MFLSFKKVLGVGVALLWCCNASPASTVFSGTVESSGQAPSYWTVNGRSMPGSVRELLQEALPVPSVAAALNKPYTVSTQAQTAGDGGNRPDFRRASVSPTLQKERDQENLMAGAPIPYLEIEVKHGEHTFTLLSHTEDGNLRTLYHCRVGLGGPEFPTPVGTYYVTHIYDDEPWWIPPKDRAWAAGEKPSKKVYGGTMAPLLKKRDVRDKKRTPSSEDMIAGRVKLEDYGYRFHGTNAPRSIGRNQSHGCVRMLPADAKKVAELIKEQVGITERRESENGSYVVLKRPVRLNLVK